MKHPKRAIFALIVTAAALAVAVPAHAAGALAGSGQTAAAAEPSPPQAKEDLAQALVHGAEEETGFVGNVLELLLGAPETP